MKKYRTLIDNLVEKGVVHAKGSILQVEVTEERAKNFINAGYIEEVVDAPAKPVEKVAEVPENKMIDGEETKKKGVIGKGAELLKKKKK